MPIRIVYFGTPDYAAPTLQRLARDPRFDVILVVTQPDREAGRGHRIVPPPVKVVAQSLGIPVAQPSTLRDESIRQQLRQIEADLFVVAAYGLIFSQAILEIPARGCLNLHASLLPKYRGAAPVTAAILQGEPKTGVTLMGMERGLDTGPIVAMAEIDILPLDTTESLSARLAVLGADLALREIPRLLAGEIMLRPQPEEATAVRQLTKADGQIDWTQPAGQIERQVRAMWPWPRAWTLLGDRAVQVHLSSVVIDVDSALFQPPGTVRVVEGNPVVICGAGTALSIDRAQLAGANPVSGGELVRGRVLADGMTLTSGAAPDPPLITAI
jgi:methionyl-tRNA formyltransferase